MNSDRLWVIALLGAVLGFASVGGAPIVRADDAQKLEREARALDAGSPSSQQAQARVRSLSQEYGVSVTTIEEARKQRPGWGDLTVQLAMAHHYAGASAERTAEQAFAEIGRRRQEKRGWGEIAHELGFQLGPVLGLVERGKQGLRTADARGVKGEKSSARHQTTDRAQRTEPKRKVQPSVPPPRSASPARPSRPGGDPGAPAKR